MNNSKKSYRISILHVLLRKNIVQPPISAKRTFRHITNARPLSGESCFYFPSLLRSRQLQTYCLNLLQRLVQSSFVEPQTQ